MIFIFAILTIFSGIIAENGCNDVNNAVKGGATLDFAITITSAEAELPKTAVGVKFKGIPEILSKSNETSSVPGANEESDKSKRCKIRQERNKYCRECNVEYEKYGVYRKHVLSEHVEAFTCHCGKSYTERKNLRAHARSRHRDPESGYQCGKRLQQRVPFYCAHCKEEFSGVAAYEKHGKITHPAKKLFDCGRCEEEFTTKKSRDRHGQDVHGGRANLKCPHCFRCYRRRDVYASHEKMCGKKLPEPGGSQFCDICRKTFKARKSFARHVKNHELFAVCRICGKRFHKGRNPRGLANHVKKRHDDEGTKADEVRRKRKDSIPG